MDPIEIVNVGVGLAAQYPQTAVVLAAIPVVQTLAAALSGLLGFLGRVRKRSHPALPTLAKWAEKVAAYPIRLPGGAQDGGK